MPRKIFIDAGHGGRDPGAVGNGMRESDIVLDVAKRFGCILAAQGFEVRQSRTTDVAATINERWRAANAWGADLYISIHANGFHLTTANGYETFIAATKPSDRDFAQVVHNALIAATGLRDRGVKVDSQSQHSGGLGVLRHSAMPAILVELAFVTAAPNSLDVATLREKRQLMAQALADGVMKYLGVATDNPHPQPQPKPKSFPIQPANVQRMVDLGVIRSPEYWLEMDGIEWLDQLFINAGGDDVLHRDVTNGISDIATAIKVLEMAGVMNTPEYWRNVLAGNLSRNLHQLIINMADRCLDPLARIIWAEARGEDLHGQILVANVVINRHNSPNFPSGLYNVIFAPNQFTPTRDGSYDRAEPNRTQNDAATLALVGTDHSQGATFFHSISGIRRAEQEGREVWHEKAAREGRLIQLFDHGNHRFYRQP